MAEKKEADKREYKFQRLLTFFSNMPVNQFHKPTPTAKKLGIHPDFFRDFIDFGESYEALGINVIRDENNKMVGCMRVNTDLNLLKDINIIKQEILQLKDLIDELKFTIKNKN